MRITYLSLAVFGIVGGFALMERSVVLGALGTTLGVLALLDVGRSVASTRSDA